MSAGNCGGGVLAPVSHVQRWLRTRVCLAETFERRPECLCAVSKASAADRSGSERVHTGCGFLIEHGILQPVSKVTPGPWNCFIDACALVEFRTMARQSSVGRCNLHGSPRQHGRADDAEAEDRKGQIARDRLERLGGTSGAFDVGFARGLPVVAPRPSGDQRTAWSIAGSRRIARPLASRWRCRSGHRRRRL